MRYFIFGPAFLRPAVVGLALAVSAPLVPAAAQQIPKSLREGPDDPQRKTQDGWSVRIAASRDDTAARFADELARALNDGDDLRVLPVLSRGPIGNVEDLLKLPEIDVAITQADALEYFRTERKTSLGTRIQYIAGLPPAQLHVAARESVHSLQELRGQKVVFGPAGSAAAVTGPILFRRLGIAVKPVYTDAAAGLDLVKSGDAAALLTVESKPGDLWLRVPPYAGIHFLPAPHGKVLADLYAAAALTSADYPNLIGPDEQVDTIAVPGVLAVQNLSKNDDRFRRVLRFVDYLYARWDRLREPPFYRGWRDVDIAATAHGWTRFSPSEVFRQFILWREKQYSRSLQ
jgi:uncharacterized protein